MTAENEEKQNTEKLWEVGEKHAKAFVHFINLKKLGTCILVVFRYCNLKLITKNLQPKNKSLDEKDSNIAKEQSQQEEELRKAETLYCEANSRLQNAIRAKDMNEMTVVQGLMDVASKKMESARRKLENCRKNQVMIGAKRRIYKLLMLSLYYWLKVE